MQGSGWSGSVQIQSDASAAWSSVRHTALLPPHTAEKPGGSEETWGAPWARGVMGFETQPVQCLLVHLGF